MRNCVWVVILALLVAPAIGVQSSHQDARKGAPALPWAYGYNAAADSGRGRAQA